MAIMTTQHYYNNVTGWWFVLKVFSLTWLLLYLCPNAVAITTVTQFGSVIDGEGEGGRFGDSVVISGDGSTLVVGAPYSFGTVSASGSVRIYERDQVGNMYVPIGSDIGGEAENDEFGFAVSISADGSTFIVGAPRTTDNANRTNAGSVRIYKRDPIGNGYTQFGSTITGRAANEYFGYSVSMTADGSTFVVGAPVADAGSVRAYKLNQAGSNYIQFGADIIGEAALDRFGFSVCISADGSTMIVGAPSFDDDSNGIGYGSARVYRIDQIGSSYVYIGLNIDGQSLGDLFGYSLSISDDGSAFAVGAYGNNFGSYVIAYNFNLAESSLVQLGSPFGGEVVDISGDGSTLIIGTSFSFGSGLVQVYKLNQAVSRFGLVGLASGQYSLSEFGFSVSISGNGTTFVVGAPGDDERSGTSAGSVLVFDISRRVAQATFTQFGPDIDGEAEGDRFGSSLGISADGSTLIVGAINNNENGVLGGSVRVYQRNQIGKGYAQIGSDIDGDAAGGYFGHSVGISADGSTWIVGAPFDGSNGSASGSVRVYQKNQVGDGYTQFGSDIDGVEGERFGYAVSMSADSSSFIVGAPFGNNGTGSARVYKLNQNDSSYKQVGSDVLGEGEFDQFGWSVGISADGSTLIVGAPYNKGNGTGFATGSVRVYKIDQAGSRYTQFGSDIYGKAEGEEFGSSVSIAGDGLTLIVGAPGYSNASGFFVGVTRVYKINQAKTDYIQFSSDIVGTTASDRFGYSTSISTDGLSFLIGAPSTVLSPFSGSVRVFRLNEGGSSYTQIGLDLYGEEAIDSFGWSVGISGDGSIFAVGAVANDNENGIDVGSVRVFDNPRPLTKAPTKVPTKFPTKFPSQAPTKFPTKAPTKFPTKAPTKLPTKKPTKAPTKFPTKSPTKAPTKHPTKAPTKFPSKTPTKAPTKRPTKAPTKFPSKTPTKAPTKHPTNAPTKAPTKVPTRRPTKAPAKAPTDIPSQSPSVRPVKAPLKIPVPAPIPVQVPLPVVVAPIVAGPVPVSAPITAPIPVTTPITAPLKTPASVPVVAPIPINIPVKAPTKSPTKSPSTSPVTVSPTTTTPVASPTNCGLFGFNLFCPRPGECGFFRRLFNINGC